MRNCQQETLDDGDQAGHLDLQCAADGEGHRATGQGYLIFIGLYFYKLSCTLKESTDSRKPDNPFRETGSLSKYARDIIQGVPKKTLDSVQRSISRV